MNSGRGGGESGIGCTNDDDNNDNSDNNSDNNAMNNAIESNHDQYRLIEQVLRIVGIFIDLAWLNSIQEKRL